MSLLQYNFQSTFNATATCTDGLNCRLATTAGLNMWRNLMDCNDFGYSTSKVSKVSSLSNKIKTEFSETQHEYTIHITKSLTRGQSEKQFNSYQMTLAKPSSNSERARLQVKSEKDAFHQVYWFDLAMIDAANIDWKREAFENGNNVLKISIPKKSKELNSHAEKSTVEPSNEAQETKASAAKEKQHIQENELSGTQQAETTDLNSAMLECEMLAALSAVHERMEMLSDDKIEC